VDKGIAPLAVIASGIMLLAMVQSAQARPVFRKPVPDGVVELSCGVRSFVELKDGSLLSADGQVSTDGGLTWNKTKSFGEGVGGSGIIRLQSGALALSAGGSGMVGWWQPLRVWLSRDEGNSWEGPYSAELLGGPLSDTMIQLSSGRLLWPTRACLANYAHPEFKYYDASSYGQWRGHRIQISGHYHYPELDIAAVGYSDDEGKNWAVGSTEHSLWGEASGQPRTFLSASGVLMGWFDARGIPGPNAEVTACDEPNVAETADGRVLFMARSTVGRLVYSYSSDQGETWTAVRPTALASSYSPPRLRRIPQTGDLICVWNQVSREEIRRGYRRGRLSVAISKDSGATWENFKTLELSEGLKDIDHIKPEYPITPVTAALDVGQLPDGWATFDYANVCFGNGKVFIMYYRGWLEESKNDEGEPTARKAGESVMRIYPLEWFYQ